MTKEDIVFRNPHAQALSKCVTPGPWGLRGWQIRADNGFGAHIATYQISEADGRLIAAAPELLALLEEIITHVATYPDQHERAKALVARIKGASR